VTKIIIFPVPPPPERYFEGVTRKPSSRIGYIYLNRFEGCAKRAAFTDFDAPSKLLLTWYKDDCSDPHFEEWFIIHKSLRQAFGAIQTLGMRVVNDATEPRIEVIPEPTSAEIAAFWGVVPCAQCATDHASIEEAELCLRT